MRLALSLSILSAVWGLTSAQDQTFWAFTSDGNSIIAGDQVDNHVRVVQSGPTTWVLRPGAFRDSFYFHELVGGSPGPAISCGVSPGDACYTGLEGPISSFVFREPSDPESTSLMIRDAEYNLYWTVEDDQIHLRGLDDGNLSNQEFTLEFETGN